MSLSRWKHTRSHWTPGSRPTRRKVFLSKKKSGCGFGKAVTKSKAGLRLAEPRLENHATAGPAIHEHHERFFESHMSHTTVAFQCRLRSKPLPVNESFIRVRIDREISHLKRGKVLEEMTPLRRHNPEIPETGLHDHSRP